MSLQAQIRFVSELRLRRWGLVKTGRVLLLLNPHLHLTLSFALGLGVYLLARMAFVEVGASRCNLHHGPVDHSDPYHHPGLAWHLASYHPWKPLALQQSSRLRLLRRQSNAPRLRQRSVRGDFVAAVQPLSIRNPHEAPYMMERCAWVALALLWQCSVLGGFVALP